MSENWLDILGRLRTQGTPCVLVTVTATEGSAPRNAGAKLIVTAERTFATIGGGHLEHEATRHARELLAASSRRPIGSLSKQKFALGPSLGQCCGGSAELMFEPMLPQEFQVVLFGAGHVGRALAQILAPLACKLTWVDNREEAMAEAKADSLPDTSLVLTDTPEQEVASASPGACFVVMTHDHDLDGRLAEAILRRDDYRYFGLIGSQTKRAKFETRLRARGIDDARLARMRCPIGIVGVGGKRPAEIAVAVAAELLSLKTA